MSSFIYQNKDYLIDYQDYLMIKPMRLEVTDVLTISNSDKRGPLASLPLETQNTHSSVMTLVSD